MKKQIIAKQIYRLEDEKEINLLKYCLDYCWHRAHKHISPVNKYKNEINKLRKQLTV